MYVVAVKVHIACVPCWLIAQAVNHSVIVEAGRGGGGQHQQCARDQENTSELVKNI